MIDVQLQEIREAARITVRARAQAEEDAAVDQELRELEHRAAMAATAGQLIAGQERARQLRQSTHAATVGEARTTRDHLATLTEQRQKVERELGGLRAYLLESEKARARCVTFDLAEEFPTPAETESHTRRIAEYDRELHRLNAMLQSASVELARAQTSEDDAAAVFRKAADAEMMARNNL